MLLSDKEMSLGIAVLLVAAIPSRTANSTELVPALSMLRFRDAKNAGLWNLGVLQVVTFLYLLEKISLAKQGEVLPPLPGELS